MAAVFVTLVLACDFAFGQQYAEEKIDDRAYRDNGLVMRLVRDPSDYGVEQKRFLDYFEKYYFPAMTHTSPETLGLLGKMRSDFFARYIQRTTSKAIQDDLTRLALDASKNIVGSTKYHPAVRYNAILILGQLDSKYAVEGAAPQPPIPHPDANKLLTIVAGSPKFTAPLNIGALIGLERHARYKDALPPAQTAEMTKTMMKIIAAKEPPAGASTSVHAWIKRQAANVLANLGQVGPNGEVIQSLVGLVSNDKLPLEDRSEVAGLLSKLDYSGATVDGKSAAASIIGLLNEISRREIKKVEEFEDTQIGGGGGAFRSERRGSRQGFGDEMKYERRQILSLLQNIQPGLKAVVKIVPEDIQGPIDSVLTAVNGVILAVGDPEVIDLEIPESIRNMEKVVSEAAKTFQAPAATAAASPEEDSRT